MPARSELVGLVGCAGGERRDAIDDNEHETPPRSPTKRRQRVLWPLLPPRAPGATAGAAGLVIQCAASAVVSQLVDRAAEPRERIDRKHWDTSTLAVSEEDEPCTPASKMHSDLAQDPCCQPTVFQLLQDPSKPNGFPLKGPLSVCTRLFSKPTEIKFPTSGTPTPGSGAE